MKPIELRMASIALLSLSLLGSCTSTTSLTAVRRDPGYQGPAKKIVVLVNARQQTERILAEDEFVKQLKAHQTDAVASHTFIPFDQMADRNVVAARVKGLGVDTTLTTRVVDRKIAEKRYAEGTSLAGYNSTLAEYYGTLGTSRYAIQDETVVLETTVYQTDGDKLVWSARSETWVAASDQELTTSFIALIVDKLASDKVIR